MTWPSPPGTVITEGPLSAELASQVQGLAAAAARADGVAPLSEDVLLQVRHGSGAQARDLSLTSGDGVLAGYAHLDAPDAEAQDGDASGELVVHPDYRRRGYGAALSSALIAGAAGTGIRLWAHGELPARSRSRKPRDSPGSARCGRCECRWRRRPRAPRRFRLA